MQSLKCLWELSDLVVLNNTVNTDISSLITDALYLIVPYYNIAPEKSLTMDLLRVIDW